MEGIGGKRALVTGGNSGIGLGIALKLCELGAEVFIVGRNKETLDSAVKESQNKITAIQLDIGRDWNKTRETIEQILPIQLLVNNAAILLPNLVLEASEEEFDSMFSINLKAILNITQVVTKDLSSRGLNGSVVNISSQAGLKGVPYISVYSMTKAALEMLTKVFAAEVAPKKIRVNSVAPTMVLTSMGKSGSQFIKEKSGQTFHFPPLGRNAEVKDMTNAVIFLLSDNSEMITGTTILVDGGILTS